MDVGSILKACLHAQDENGYTDAGYLVFIYTSLRLDDSFVFVLADVVRKVILSGWCYVQNICKLSSTL